jgi:hypothetical protein
MALFYKPLSWKRGNLSCNAQGGEEKSTSVTSLLKPFAPFYCSLVTQFHTQAPYNLLAACRTFWLTREPHNLRNRR